MPAACCVTRRGPAWPTPWFVTARRSPPRRWPRPNSAPPTNSIEADSDSARPTIARAAGSTSTWCCSTPASSRTPRTDAALAELREYHKGENLWEHVEPDVEPALAALRARGLRLVVVSNANGRLRHLFDRLQLTRWFDHVLDSHDWGSRSPIRGCFSWRSSRPRADAARTVHVGDLYHVDVMGARRAGLRDGVLFDMAGLYGEVDCPRVGSFAALVEWIDKTRGNQTLNRVP